MTMIARLAPFLIVLSVFTVDRLTKFLVKAEMSYGQSKQILPFFSLTYVENTGAAFGLGQNQNTFFILSSLLILVILFAIARKVPKEDIKMRFALALVIGGALGNLYDRLHHGSVTDFLDFYVGAHHWYAFNVADSCVCIGALLLAVFQWKGASSS